MIKVTTQKLFEESEVVIDDLPNWKEQITSDWSTVLKEQIWKQHDQILPAPTLTQAQANAVALPLIIYDHTKVGEAINITLTSEENIYYVTNTYGNLATRLGEWISPTIVPRTDAGNIGLPSLGYIANLYNGNPDTGGTIIEDMDETNQNRWSINYGYGVIVIGLAEEDIIDNTDLWITGFRYIGTIGV